MKFERHQSSSASTLVTTDDVVLANRYEERRAKEEAERRSVPVSEYARVNLAQKLRSLGSSMDVSGLRDWSPTRPADLRGKESTKEAAEKHLAEIQARYLAEPLKVSKALSLSHPAPEYVGEEL